MNTYAVVRNSRVRVYHGATAPGRVRARGTSVPRTTTRATREEGRRRKLSCRFDVEDDLHGCNAGRCSKLAGTGRRTGISRTPGPSAGIGRRQLRVALAAGRTPHCGTADAHAHRQPAVRRLVRAGTAGNGRRSRRGDPRPRLQRWQAGAVRLLRNRRTLALRLDARCQLCGRSCVGAAGAGAHAQCTALQALGRTRWAHAWTVRGAGHRLRRQLADQQRPSGVVPCRPWLAGRQAVCRRGVAGATGNDRAGPRCRVRCADRSLPRRNLVPRLARTDLSGLDARRRAIHCRILCALHQRAALPGVAAGRTVGAPAWRCTRYAICAVGRCTPPGHR